MTITISAIERAEPSGQLRPGPNCRAMRLPIIRCLAAAQNPRRDIGAKRRNENQNGAGDDAGLDKRNDDAAQHLSRVGVKIVSCLDQPEIEFLHEE